MKALTWIALVLVVVGAANWGLVGFAQFDLVATLFGGSSALISRVVTASSVGRRDAPRSAVAASHGDAESPARARGCQSCVMGMQ
jgi:hypothetical protein